MLTTKNEQFMAYIDILYVILHAKQEGQDAAYPCPHPGRTCALLTIHCIMEETLSQLDAHLIVWLNGFHTPFFDNLMYLASGKWVWVPMYVALFAVTVMHFGLRRRTLAILALFAIAITLADTVCADYIRPFFNRPRPTQPDSGISALIHTVNDYRGGHYGMASCHSANSFALATLVAMLFRRRHLTWFFYLWAAFHTYTRIYLGVHYMGDILVGGLVGTAIAWLTCRIACHYVSLIPEPVNCHSALVPYTGIATLGVLAVVSAAALTFGFSVFY